jgi:hypothetical protein
MLGIEGISVSDFLAVIRRAEAPPSPCYPPSTKTRLRLVLKVLSSWRRFSIFCTYALLQDRVDAWNVDPINPPV